MFDINGTLVNRTFEWDHRLAVSSLVSFKLDAVRFIKEQVTSMSGLKRKPERLFFIGQFVRLRRQGNWRFRPFRFLRGKRGLRRLSDGFFQIIFAHVPAVIDRAKGFDEIKPKLRVANISLIPRIRSVLNGAVDV